jgi:hypothetical protein
VIGQRAWRRKDELIVALVEREQSQLVSSIQQFIRMYNSHEAREDTVLLGCSYCWSLALADGRSTLR